MSMAAASLHHAWSAQQTGALVWYIYAQRYRGIMLEGIRRCSERVRRQFLLTSALCGFGGEVGSGALADLALNEKAGRIS